MTAPSPSRAARGRASVVRRALDTPRLTLDLIAEATGVSRGALAKYREASRPMPAEVRLRLAAFLEGHARRLLALAEQLRVGVGSAPDVPP